MALNVPRGKFNQRITLMRPVLGVDGLGQASETFVDDATVWASAEPLRGREMFAAAQAQSEIQIRFEINYRPGVLESWRARHKGQVYKIDAVIDTKGAGVQLELLAHNISAPGLSS